MRKSVIGLMVAASIALAGNAQATTVNILDFTPTFVLGEPISSFGSNPNLDAELANQQSALVTFFSSHGAKTTILPTAFSASDLAGVQLTIIDLPSSVPSPSQLVALNNYVGGGGRILLITEHADGFFPQIANGNAILAGLGSSISNKTSFFDNDFHVTTGISPDPFTAGVHTIVYAATSSLTGGVELGAGLSGQDFIAREPLGAGQLFVIADSNLISFINFGDNAQLFLNVLGGEAPSPAPEPATLLLFTTTAAGLGVASWRKRRGSHAEPQHAAQTDCEV